MTGLGAIFDFFDWLAGEYGGIWDKFKAIIDKLFDEVEEMFKDMLIYVVDTFLDLTTTILETIAIDFSVFDPSTYFSAMPAEVSQVIGIIRIPEAIGIIVAAIAIKMLLQLIPFTRLGS
jgi:hypothetical protein